MSQQTSPGRLKRLLIGFVVGSLAVGAFMAYAQFKPGSIDPGANLGPINKAERTFGAPRTTPYPSDARRRDYQVTFTLRQAGTVVRFNWVTSVTGQEPKKETQVRVATRKRNTRAESGDLLVMSAEIVKNDRDIPGAGPLECTLVIDGLIYRSHSGHNPYNVNGTKCQASAVAP